MDEVTKEQAQEWFVWLQRRLMRLLLTHDQALFRSQFRTFFVESALTQVPLLQQYDRYIRLLVLSDELLDDILPRIRRQLSLQTDHARLLEEAPTRGDIDWPRTFERTLRETPGLPATQFNTRLRQRSTTTPENLLTVAVLLAYRQEIARVQREDMGDESLSKQELHVLIGADERAERELAAPYARDLLHEASHSEVAGLAQHVLAHLRPGANPYRDLVDWWGRFQGLSVGHSSGEKRLAIAAQRDDAKVDAWLYELWIALEFVNLLHAQQAIIPADTSVAVDHLQFVFSWHGRRFRFSYNRQREESTGDGSAWAYGPASRPDYCIEREEPLRVPVTGKLVWREPPFVMDAKYYLSGSDPTRTHGPIKKLLGDMTLLDAPEGLLLFPLLAEPLGEQHITRTLRRKQHRHRAGMALDLQIHLCHISPEQPVELVQKRLHAILEHAIKNLPERAEPVCEGIWLDTDTKYASAIPMLTNAIVCRKRHIGNNVFDIVYAELQCLKDPTVCHVIGKGVVRPEVVRVTNREALHDKSSSVRIRSEEQLQQAEQSGNEELAEQLRKQIFESIGSATEQYVKLRGNTKQIEDKFKWIFNAGWMTSTRALAPETRNMLLSGEFVWYDYQGSTLQDWAAPAVQYCRALEVEIRRRLYNHRPAPAKYAPPDPAAFKVSGAGWTLGTLKWLHDKKSIPTGDAAHNWLVLRDVIGIAQCDMTNFMSMLDQLVSTQIVEYRNHLAHGNPVSETVAKCLREAIIGEGGQQGILHWLTQHLDPVP